MAASNYSKPNNHDFHQNNPPMLADSQKHTGVVVVDVSDNECEDGYETSPYNSDDDPAKVSPKITVNPAEFRSLVQCGICSGISRRTRTVMECLHRFCKECIDKSMRLGNNECPTCRTHCASWRSLRDDSNYDNIIASIFPDIDAYEKEVQTYIAETLQKQSKALGKRTLSGNDTIILFGNSSRGRGRGHVRNTTIPSFFDDDVDDEDEDENIDHGEEFPSSDEPSPDRKKKRRRRRVIRRPSPARAAVSAASEENTSTEAKKRNIGRSSLTRGGIEVPAWGKNRTRSHTRHGKSSGTSSTVVKSERMTKLVEYLHNLSEADDEGHLRETESSQANLRMITTSWRALALAVES